MKNMKLFVPVLCAALLSFYAIGCGSNASGGGGGGGGSVASGFSGKLSDPYVSGAIVIVDMNGSGSYDSTVTGEMIATTDATGGFTFPQQPTYGGTIEQITAGTHLGVTYDGEFMGKTINSSEVYNLSPLTNWGTHGITDGAIAALISKEGISIQASAIGNDPMYGLSGITTFDSSAVDAIKSIKAAIFAYSVSRIASNEYGADYDLADLNTPLMISVEAAIATAVNSGISDTLLIAINNQIDSMNTTLATYGQAALPHATAEDRKSVV
jgi:hypothetical protein